MFIFAAEYVYTPELLDRTVSSKTAVPKDEGLRQIRHWLAARTGDDSHARL